MDKVIYLIEHDEGDHLSFVGIYEDIDSFISDIKVELIAEMHENGFVIGEVTHKMINKEGCKNCIEIRIMHTYWKYYYSEVELNKSYWSGR